MGPRAPTAAQLELGIPSNIPPNRTIAPPERFLEEVFKVTDSMAQPMKVIVIGAGKLYPIAFLLHLVKEIAGSTGLLLAQGLKQVLYFPYLQRMIRSNSPLRMASNAKSSKKKIQPRIRLDHENGA